MSNHTHRTIPQSKDSLPRPASNWGGGVWQLAIVCAVAIIYVLITGPATTDSQKAFREAIVVLSLMALLIAVFMQQLKRMREASGGNVRR